MVTMVLLARSWPKSGKVTLLEPTGTVTAGGTPTTAGSLLLRETDASNEPVTGPVIVTVALALLPATIELGLMANDCRVAPPAVSTNNWPKTSTVPTTAAKVIGHWKAVAA